MSEQTEGKRTKGPWTVEGEKTIYDNNRTIRYAKDGLASRVAKLFDGALCPEHGTVEANARLIAAAPEMVEALKQGLDALCNETHGGKDSPWIAETKAKMRDALRKAGAL